MEHRGVIIDVRDLDLDRGQGGERGGASITSDDDDTNRWTFRVELGSVADEQGSWGEDSNQSQTRLMSKQELRSSRPQLNWEGMLPTVIWVNVETILRR